MGSRSLSGYFRVGLRLVVICLILMTGWGCAGIEEREASIRQLRVLTYNIHHGEAMDGEFDYERLAKVITDLEPDVVALQEVDRGTQRAGGVDQPALLGKLTGMYFAFGQAMPYQGGQYGEAVLSRFPIEKVEVYPLPFRPGQEPRAALVTYIKPDNGLPEFIFVGTHLCHQSNDTRTEQARQMNRVLTDREGPPVILAGDLNARTDSDPMNELLTERWTDVIAPQSRIDYILVRPTDLWKVVEVKITDERVVSDHLPVLAMLEWTGDR
ncbi:endonuclease/exonuclease/phosphatase family protein [Planctomycetota bacterium]